MVADEMRAIGRYQLLEQLGEGGFGTVYRAYDPALDREVALKVLQPALARHTAMRERFLREGRALARIRHQNVVQVFDTGEAANTAYLAMELIQGTSLAVEMTRRSPLPLAEVVAIVDQVAAALTAVHARRLLHRDVKPANIIVEAETGRAVLLDLGVARVLDAVSLTWTGYLVGTLSY